ncbi:MAG: preprotein translocase subunit SecA, partial [Candidatus Omnitrophica bacterium]|nr:preprotein translocase subunit SecA [Candidatus Omnitrophota bacterium]
IATNMAGRGTDIVLGGNAEYLAKNLAEEKTGKDEDPQAKEDLTKKFIEQFRQQVKEEHERVVEAGGLLVIGTERHESRRIDNQLRGRQGRQGDPGASRFFVSLEDDLMRLFASDKIIGVMDKLGMEEGQVSEHPRLCKDIQSAQRRVEGHNFEIRKHLLEYDNVMNRQREVIYDLRRSVLESSDMKGLIMEAIEDSVDASVMQHLFSGAEEISFDVEGLDNYLKTTFHYGLGDVKEKFQEMGQGEIQALILKGLKGLYVQKEEAMGIDQIRHIERMLLMQTIDAKWKDHLYGMDQLKEGVGLRSFAQRDPLIEYKKEGFEMFQAMYSSIHQEVAELIFRIQQAGPSQKFRSVFSSVPQQFVHNEVSGLS